MTTHALPAAIVTPRRETRAGNRSTVRAAVPRLTPNTVVDLVNQGRMSVEDADAAMKTLEQPRLKVARQATFGVRIAMPVPGDTRPGAAIACLQAAVTQAVSGMSWSQVVDDSPDGYAIDPPAPTGTSTVHAFLRLRVSVAAYRPYRFPATARDLLHRDLQHLRERGIRVGRVRRWSLRDPDRDLWSRPRAVAHDRYEDPWPHPDTGRQGVDPPRYIHVRLYDEADLFDVDPFDPFQAYPIETA